MTLPPLDLPAIATLAALPRWVLWRYEQRDGKWTKVPLQPSGRLASTTDETTWASFEACAQAFAGGLGDGLGFVFNGDGLVGIDLDHCIDEHGQLAEWATQIVEQVDSYAEESPSGRGLHVIARGALPGRGRKNARLEVYGVGRFFTMTGKVWPGARDTIEDRGEPIARLVTQHFGARPASDEAIQVGDFELRADAEPPQPKLQALLAHAKFRRTWNHERLDLRRAGGSDDTSSYDLALATFAARAGWTDQEIANLLIAHRREHGGVEKALRGDYMTNTLRRARSSTARAEPPPFGEAQAPAASEEEPLDPDGDAEAGEVLATAAETLQAYSPFTDLANAIRIVEAFGEDMKFVKGLGWIVWNPATGRWEFDEEAARARAQHVGRLIAAEAATLMNELGQCADEEQRKRLRQQAEDRLKWATKSEMRQRIDAALVEAQPHLAIDASALDANPDLLNCTNGTLDLATLELRKHRREDLITKTTGIAYDPTARSELWETFLKRALPNEGARSFAQKYCGYGTQGRPREDKLLIAHGPTRTGKGTFESAAKAALGEYATATDFSTLAERDRRQTGNPRPDLVRLRGARLVLVYETGENLRLDAALVNQLCGSDPIVARTVYKDLIEFVPQFSLILATNHRPKVPSADDAIWERLVELPFTVHIPREATADGHAGRDPKVRERLGDAAESGAAVLAWMVAGLKLYREKGLDAPKVVEEATTEYREAMDPLKDFLAACCVLKPDAWVSAALLRDTYETWCRNRGERALVGKPWGAALRRHGVEDDPRHAGKGWLGIGLLAPDPSVTS